VEDNCLIGGGAVIFNNAKIRKGAIIGMGAVVLEGVEVPPNTIFVGIPARRLRELKKNELGKTLRHAKEHARLAKLYLKRHKAGTKEG
jgi:carbonic anhydrase/acetyltransferase-like protein (isoleucine patch superfamily)